MYSLYKILKRGEVYEVENNSLSWGGGAKLIKCLPSPHETVDLIPNIEQNREW